MGARSFVMFRKSFTDQALANREVTARNGVTARLFCWSPAELLSRLRPRDGLPLPPHDVVLPGPSWKFGSVNCSGPFVIVGGTEPMECCGQAERRAMLISCDAYAAGAPVG